MAESNNSSSSGGIGISGALFIVFLVLKLADVGVVATWPWIWVCSPLWLPLLIVIGVFALIITIKFVGSALGAIGDFFARRGRMSKFDID